MMAMRRCPSSIRCRVAVRQPCQLVVPTDRMPGPGSSGGSITTSGMRAAASRCSSLLSGRFSTVSAPSVPRAVARFSQAVNPPGESTVLTTTLAPASSAACTVPRSSSSAHGVCRVAISRSTTPKPSREATWYPSRRSSAAIRARVPAATSVRPLSTLDTADTDTPASAAMPASVLRPVPRATAAPVRRDFRNFSHLRVTGEGS